MKALLRAGIFLPATTGLRQPYPDWLYNALPYIYLWGGFCVIVLLPGWLSVFSGLTLMSAAGVVWMYREHYRRRRPQPQSGDTVRVKVVASLEASASAVDSGVPAVLTYRNPVQVRRDDALVPAWAHDAPVQAHVVADMGEAFAPDAPGPMPEFNDAVWRKSIECGHPTLDAQRLGLFLLCNDLLEIVIAKAPPSETQPLLDRLVGQMSKHLSTEDEVLVRIQRPLATQIQAQRDAMLAKANGFRDRFQGGDRNIHEFIRFVTYDVIAVHLAAKLAPASEGPKAVKK